MNLQNMRVAPKLWASIIGLLVIMLISNLWVQNNTERALEKAHADLQKIERKIAASQHLRGTALAASEIGIAQFATNEPRVQQELRKRLTANAQVTVAAFEAMVKTLETDGERAAFAKLSKIRTDLRALRMDAEKNLDADDFNARANFAFGPYASGADAYYQAFDDFIAYQQAQQTVVINESAKLRDRSVMLGWTVSGVLLLIGVLLARWLVQNITRPLQEAVVLVENIGNGNLTVNVKTQRQDEFGQLLSALGTMVGKLRSVIGEVRSGVDAVSSAAGQIASGNQDLSARTEQTAANLQQTAASVEQMNATVVQSTDTSRQANQLATTAVQAAERGGEVVQSVVHSMEQINNSSRKISDIIGVIDGIAFQTNILALNAAVEAARAGEQGRGFAVVAGEVRSLAQRSAEAAKEIKALISASVSSVEVGSVQVSQAGENMQEIVASVRRVTDLIGEITASASEQSQGFSQVNQAVNNLDQMTQQNAALVEESSAAANAMNEQAQRLRDVVAVFDVGSFNVRSGPAAFTASHAASKPAKPQAFAQPALRPAVKTSALHKPAASVSKPSAALDAPKSNEDDWETF